MRGPLNKRFRGKGSIFAACLDRVFYRPIYRSRLKSLISIKKLRKNNFTDLNMTVCEFSDRSVKYTRREFYISRLGGAIDLKFSSELDIVE